MDPTTPYGQTNPMTSSRYLSANDECADGLIPGNQPLPIHLSRLKRFQNNDAYQKARFRQKMYLL